MFKKKSNECLAPLHYPPPGLMWATISGFAANRCPIIGHLIASDNPRLWPYAPYAVLLYCMQLSNPSLVPRLVQSPMVILRHLITGVAPGCGLLPFKICQIPTLAPPSPGTVRVGVVGPNIERRITFARAESARVGYRESLENTGQNSQLGQPSET